VSNGKRDGEICELRHHRCPKRRMMFANRRWEVAMSGPRLRSPGYLLLAIVCVAVMGVTAMMTSAFVFGVKAIIAEAKLLANEGWIMSGTGVPTPDQDFLSTVESLYLTPFSSFSFEPLTTPEQFCPIICNASEPDLTFGDSLNQGVSDLNNVIVPALQGGNDVAVLGYSQSADIATIEMNDLINNTPANVNLSDLSVTLLGDPNSPIGGILDRFQFPDGVGAFSLSPEPQHVPFLNIPLSLDPTPTSPITTDIYTGEYDGWANFPEDPSNLLADINALVGIETVHPFYPDPTPGVNLDTNNIIDIGTIGHTTFYDIPAPLPLLAFLYDGGPAGQFFYDAFAPELSLGIDWSYGNPGDPGAGFAVNGVDPIGVSGPWAVDATGQLADISGVAGFDPQMDPLQMLAGEEYASVQSFVGPINDLLQDAGQSPLPASFVNSLLSGYDFTNELDTSLLTAWTDLTANIPSLSPDAILDGAPLISGQPLIDLVGYGFDIFNFFGA
jgi:PE-PPE domain